MDADKRRRRYRRDPEYREREKARKTRWRRKHKAAVDANNRRYDSSFEGLCRRFRTRYNARHNSAARLARMVLDDHCRCAICGIPNWLVQDTHRRGGPYPHVGAKMHRNTWARMHVDHIIPGGPSTKKNTRPLCPACNIYRGAGMRSDEAVLGRIRWWWRENRPLRFLWWLNTSPGRGGRAYRSAYTERRAKLWRSNELSNR